MAFRLPRAIEKASSTESSEELTQNDVNELTAELKKHLPIEVVERVERIFSSFIESKSEETKLKGSVSESSKHSHFIRALMLMTVFLLQIEIIQLLIQGAIAEANLNEKASRIVIELKDECTPSETTVATTTNTV